jgi:two-component system sensor histidine kinase VicK
MNSDSLPSPSPASPETQLLALQEENARLREELAALQPDDYSQARFRTVFENAPLGQKIITPDLTIRQVNQAVVSMLGFTSMDEVVGHKIIEFANPQFKADWHHLQTQLWEHKLPHFTLETCLMRTDGSSFWCQVTSVLVPDESGELGYTILEDISVRKRLEDKLKRVYDAQETILQLATHDMKAPVAQIELLVDLLQRELTSRNGEAPPPPEMVHYLGLIQKACAHASTLLQDILYVGDLDENGLQKSPTDLNDYLTTRVEGFRLAAREKGVQLALDLPSQSVHDSIHPEKFGRALENLFSNAIKFTPAGGKITMGLRDEAGKARLTVQDTGIGIPGKLHANLFDKFNPSRRAGLKGETTTGLGLFITRQIVELHGGHIWLESRERQGSCFFIELP